MLVGLYSRWRDGWQSTHEALVIRNSPSAGEATTRWTTEQVLAVLIGCVPSACVERPGEHSPAL